MPELRLLVTGGSGHLGKAILRQLQRSHPDAEVVAVASRPESARRLAEHGFRAVALDLVASELRWEGRFDALFHCAARMDPCAPAELFQANVLGTARLLDSLRGRVDYVVHASSIAVYEQSGFYGPSKRMAEQVARNWAVQTSTPLLMLRLASLYGPGETLQRALPTFFQRALAHEPITLGALGRARRNYLYVRDAAERMVGCLAGRPTGCCDLAGERVVTLKTLAEAVIKACESRSELVLMPGRPTHLVFPTSPATQLLGPSEGTLLPLALRQQAAWLRSGQDCLEFL